MLAIVRSSGDIYNGHFAPCGFRPIRVVPFRYTSLRFTLYDRIRCFTKAFWAFSKSQNRFPASFLSLPASLMYSTPANTDFSLHAIRHQIPAQFRDRGFSNVNFYSRHKSIRKERGTGPRLYCGCARQVGWLVRGRGVHEQDTRCMHVGVDRGVGYKGSALVWTRDLLGLCLSSRIRADATDTVQ